MKSSGRRSALQQWSPDRPVYRLLLEQPAPDPLDDRQNIAGLRRLRFSFSPYRRRPASSEALARYTTLVKVALKRRFETTDCA